DHAADLLLAPTDVAMGHLANEGLADRSVLVGDVMTDVLYRVRDRVIADPPGLPAGVEAGRFRVATLHRPDNTDDPVRLSAIVDQLAALEMPVLLAAHPRLKALAAQHGIDLARGAVMPV